MWVQWEVQVLPELRNWWATPVLKHVQVGLAFILREHKERNRVYIITSSRAGFQTRFQIHDLCPSLFLSGPSLLSFLAVAPYFMHWELSLTLIVFRELHETGSWLDAASCGLHFEGKKDRGQAGERKRVRALCLIHIPSLGPLMSSSG